MHRGYIKLWRKIEDSFLMSDPDALWLWIRLLLKANHADKEFMFNGEKLIIKRGQLLTGRKSLVDKHDISESKVYRLLKTFENEQLIEQRKTNAFTLISIVCYEQYQSTEQLIEQPVNNQRTTSEQPVNTNKNDKNYKNDKNVKNNVHTAGIQPGITAAFESIWLLYPSKTNRKDAERHFRVSVKTDNDLDDIKKALNNYIKSERVRKGFIQNGSTWFNNWRDWINWEEPKKETMHARQFGTESERHQRKEALDKL